VVCDGKKEKKQKRARLREERISVLFRHNPLGAGALEGNPVRSVDGCGHPLITRQTANPSVAHNGVVALGNPNPTSNEVARISSKVAENIQSSYLQPCHEIKSPQK
jgi:hypothetical protein